MISVTDFKKVNSTTVKAVASILIDGKILIEKVFLKKFPSSPTLIVKMPEVKEADGRWVGVVAIMDMKLREEITAALLELYNKEEA